MNIDPENYSKYTLRRFAALLDVICWVWGSDHFCMVGTIR